MKKGWGRVCASARPPGAFFETGVASSKPRRPASSHARSFPGLMGAPGKWKENAKNLTYFVSFCKIFTKNGNKMEKAVDFPEERQIRNIKDYIVRTLKKNGAYNPGLGYQIEMVASDILVYRKLRSALLVSPDLTTTETSREGYPRLRVNPLLFELREQSKVVQKGLDLLTMNIKSKKGKEQAKDSLSEFMESMND